MPDPAPPGGATDWTTHALCRQAREPDAWYPRPGRGSAQPAIRVCVRCPVQRSRLNEALIRPEPYGVWGGLTEQQRAHLRSRAAAQTGARELDGFLGLAAPLDQFVGAGKISIARGVARPFAQIDRPESRCVSFTRSA